MSLFDMNNMTIPVSPHSSKSITVQSCYRTTNGFNVFSSHVYPLGYFHFEWLHTVAASEYRVSLIDLPVPGLPHLKSLPCDLVVVQRAD